MKAFGYEFAHLDESHVEDLQSLEREKAIYTDHWIDELDDFRHVRIAMSDEEIAEYLRSMVAYDLFLGSPAGPAKDVPGIPADIAARADAYQLKTTDGGITGRPWYCPAGFMGDHLEAVLCTNERAQVIEEQGIAALLSTIRRAIDSLTPAIRAFRDREKGLAPWPVAREDDVRDLLYAMLRGSIDDIRREEPIPSKAGVSKVADLFSRVGRTIVEVKWIGRPTGWRQILEEINDDIQTYGRHQECFHLIFVVVDAARAVPDPRLVEAQLSGEQTIDGRRLSVIVFIREP